MNSEPVSPPRPHVPEIVPIVLTQVARLRAQGAITQQKFDRQIHRLSAEELEPRGLSLLVRELADGHTRFLIKGRSGTVCDLIECDGACSRASAA